MTDNTQAELDEILGWVDHQLYASELAEMKQQILDWHNKQIIKTRIEAADEILARHTAIARLPGSHAITPLIAANYATEQRNKLKER